MNVLATAASEQQLIIKKLTEYISAHVSDSTAWHLPFVPIHELPFGLTLHMVMMLIAATFLVVMFCMLYKKNARVPSGVTNLLEVLVVFVRDEIAIPNIGEKDGRRLTPLLCTFFFFILTLNVMGLIPLFSTATANKDVTFALAMITFATMVFGAIIVNGPVGFFKAFIPHGVPAPILVILVPIEFVGIFIKAGALMIRLFANMLAGHIVLFSFIGMAVAFGAIVAPFPLAMATCIYMLEILVAFLQAYIFTMLTAMFIGQLWHPSH